MRRSDINDSFKLQDHAHSEMKLKTKIIKLKEELNLSQVTLNFLSL